MVLTFNDKLALFKVANTTEYERGLEYDEVIALEKLFDSCDITEQDILKSRAYMACDAIELRKFHVELQKRIDEGIAFRD
jgi:hypothetical protein